MSSDLLLSAFTAIRHSEYSTISAVTFVACDIVSNFHSEVEFIWRATWGLVKVIYIIVRYWAFVYNAITFILNKQHHSVEFCRQYLWLLNFGGGVVYVTLVSIIFILRTYALYNRSRLVLVFFCFICAVELGLVIYGITWMHNHDGSYDRNTILMDSLPCYIILLLCCYHVQTIHIPLDCFWHNPQLRCAREIVVRYKSLLPRWGILLFGEYDHPCARYGVNTIQSCHIHCGCRSMAICCIFLLGITSCPQSSTAFNRQCVSWRDDFNRGDNQIPHKIRRIRSRKRSMVAHAPIIDK